MPSGIPFTDERVTQRICHLLRHSQLTIREIGQRFGLSKTVVVRINREFGIREYDGHFHWTVKAIAGAPENKMLPSAPENKRRA